MLSTLISLRTMTVAVVTALALGYVCIWTFGGVPITNAFNAWYFFLIGIGGASIANSTGTGGGVVFVPAFTLIQNVSGVTLGTGQIVAMSFLIQSFGMTVGSLTWARRLATHKTSPIGILRAEFIRLILISLAGCLPALWLTQLFMQIDAQQLLVLFKSFSLMLGLILLGSTLLPHKDTRDHLLPRDQWVILTLSIAGGVATALFSVGVGEFVALYLFIRGYSLNTSVASAVFITAVTVIAGAPASILLHDIYWPLVAMAVPGVMIGGFLGRRIAHALGATRLKRLAALWIIGSSAYLILRAF